MTYKEKKDHIVSLSERCADDIDIETSLSRKTIVHLYSRFSGKGESKEPVDTIKRLLPYSYRA